MKKNRIEIVYVSRYGHTKLLAEAVAHGAADAGADTVLTTTAEGINNLEKFDAADAIVFGTPTYMGNLSSEMKIFMEKCVGRWFSRAWQDKIAGGFTCSSNFSGDKTNTMIGLATFAMQMGMIWVGLGDLVAANAPKDMTTPAGPGPEALNRNSGSFGPLACSFELKAPDAPGAGDLQTGENYGRRIAELTARFNRK